MRPPVGLDIPTTIGKVPSSGKSDFWVVSLMFPHVDDLLINPVSGLLWLPFIATGNFSAGNQPDWSTEEGSFGSWGSF